MLHLKNWSSVTSLIPCACSLFLKTKFKVGFIYGINLIGASRFLSLIFSNQAPNDPDQIICIFALLFKEKKSRKTIIPRGG